MNAPGSRLRTVDALRLTTPSPRRLGAIAAIAVGVATAYALTPVPFTTDDAYILVHSAHVFRDGSDPAYGAPALVGVTSPAFFAVVLILQGVGLDAIVALRLVSAFGWTLAAAGLWTLAAGVGVAWYWRAFLLGALFAVPQMANVMTNGLESGTAFALVLWLLVWVTTERRALVAVGVGVLPAMRPDLLPIAGAVWLYAFWRQPWPVRARGALLSALALAPWPIWLWSETGAWIPQTIAAKRVFFAENCLPLSRKAIVTWAGVTGWGGRSWPILLGAWRSLRSRLGLAGLGAAALVLVGYTITFPGAIWHNDHRYLVPLLVPWLALGLFATWARWQRTIVAPAMACAIVALNVYPQLRPLGDRPMSQEYLDAANWMAANIPSDATIMVHEAGVPSVYAAHRLVDLVGLKSPTSIGPNDRWIGGSCAMNRGAALAEIVRNSGARYLQTMSDWAVTFEIPDGLRREGFSVEPIKVPITGERAYTIWRLVPPETPPDVGRRRGAAARGAGR